MRINEIEEIIPHQSFNHRAINRRHDIGLIRLKRSVQYTCKKCFPHFSFIELTLNSPTAVVRPVCLPLPSLPELRTGDSVYVVGFGRTLHSKMSAIKQKLRLPVYDHSVCRKRFAVKNVDVTDDQICAGGEFSRDACDGGKRRFVSDEVRSLIDLRF